MTKICRCSPSCKTPEAVLRELFQEFVGANTGFSISTNRTIGTRSYRAYVKVDQTLIYQGPARQDQMDAVRALVAVVQDTRFKRLINKGAVSCKGGCNHA